MSDRTKDWNTAEIRQFKAAFGTHKQTFLKFAKDSLGMLKQAIGMLQKRSDKGTDTSMGIIIGTAEVNGRKMTHDLQTASGDLFDRSRAALKQAREITDSSWAGDIDAVTSQLMSLTDEWTAFEAQAISGRLLMIANPTDDALWSALLDQATGLRQTANDLVAAKVKDAQPVHQEVNTLYTSLASNPPDDYADAAATLDKLQAKLSALAASPSPPLANPEQAYRKLMKQLYGVDVGEVDGATKDNINYQRLFKAFAMVPTGHSRNARLATVEFGPVTDGSGYYDPSRDAIRVQANITERAAHKYINPETKKEELLDGFALTTLHEIGHSVDAAHRLMETHQAKPGCGGWTTQDPFEYQRAGFDNARTPLRNAIRQFYASVAPDFKIPDPGDGELEKGYRAYCGGQTLNDAFKAGLAGVLEQAAIKASQDMKANGTQPVDDLGFGIRDTLSQATPGTEVAALWSAVEKLANAAVIAMDTYLPGRLTFDEVRRRFFALFGDAATVPEKPPDPKPLVAWLPTLYAEPYSAVAIKVVTLPDAAQTWTDHTTVAIDPPLDLSKYKPAAKPWDTDLSTVTIAGLPAAHQAYDSNTLWWRYSNRAATMVSNYQWRAPGEWFAEIYALSWFMKVEPPSPVPQELRAYLFGASMPV
jgi:hypothetical protein